MNKLKNILITGCSTGIGRALAVAMAEAGCTVYATARRPETLAAIAGERLKPMALDVLDPDSMAAACQAMVDEVGSIDMLINNAGVSNTGPMVEAPLGTLKQLLDTNLGGAVGMIQAVFPHMARQGFGRVVNVGSVVGELPVPFTAVYCATKAGLHMLSDVLRMELKPFGIDVVTVQPASVRTEIETRSAEGVKAYQSETSRYRSLYSYIEKRYAGNEAQGMSTEQFCQQILPALLKHKAPRVVSGGANNGLLQFLLKLPERLRDSLIAKEYGLNQTLKS